MSETLIVSLEEFAELVGVTAETMRVHLREVGRDGSPAPGWLIEKGDRGRAYKIEADGAIAWWREKRESEEAQAGARAERLQQLRFETIGAAVETPEMLTLSGRARREEYAAAMEAIKYRRAIGELVEKAGIQRVLISAVIELRRALQAVPPEFAIAAGLDRDQQRDLDRRLERAVDTFVTVIEKPNAFAE